MPDGGRLTRATTVGDNVPYRTVRIPEPLAEALEMYGPQLIDELRGIAEERRQEERQAKAAAAAADRHHAAVFAVHLFRRFRHERRRAGGGDFEVCRRLAERGERHPAGFELRARDVLNIVRGERARVHGHLRERRAVRVCRLYRAGWRNADIAAVCGCGTSTVARVLRERADVLAALRQGHRPRRLPDMVGSGGA
jgi:hypothetical protein